MSAIANAARILRCLAAQRRSLGVTEIARTLGLTKSGTHHLLTALVGEGLVARESASRQYRLGSALYELGLQAVSAPELERAAGQHLSTLGRHTGGTVLLGVLDCTDVVYIHRLEGRKPVVLSARVGGRLPAHCTATGRALLAHQVNPTVNAALTGSLAAYNTFTMTDPAIVRRQLAVIRKQGFAICDQEVDLGCRAVSAPIQDAEGCTIGAITVAVPAVRMEDRIMYIMGALVLETAQRVSRQVDRVHAT